MKKFLRPWLIAPVLLLSLAAIAAPQLDGAVKELNAEISRVLSDYQNQTTKAQLAFAAIKTDEVRALAVKLKALYSKKGSQNTLTVKLDDLSYDYKNGVKPTTKVRGSIGLDITKILPQETLKEIIPGVEQMVQEFAKEYTRDYGDAATVVAKVTEKNTDAGGNFVSIKAVLSGKIDLSKLPAGKKAEDVLFTEAKAQIAVDLKKGVAVTAVLVSNPRYSGFREDQDGLKEVLEKLLARDAKEIKEISDTFKGLDGFAGQLVEGKLFN